MLQKDWKNKFSIEAGSGKNSQDSGGLHKPFGRVLYKINGRISPDSLFEA